MQSNHINEPCFCVATVTALSLHRATCRAATYRATFAVLEVVVASWRPISGARAMPRGKDAIHHTGDSARMRALQHTWGPVNALKS